MVNLSTFQLLKLKIKYHMEFMSHCKSRGHNVTEEDLRLKEVIQQNYYKSLFFSNLFAFYLNYIRKNKSFAKTFLSKIFYI
jgi:hypothetical protein